MLLTLSLAALDQVTAQTTLRRLADDVVALAADTPMVEPFDTTAYSERRAFVDALKWLVETGVLTLRDGDTERYAKGDAGDALFDVHDRILAQLLAAPIPPSLAGTPEAMRRELYADTEEGRRLRARYSVTRRLADEPVLYLEDLDERQRDWLDHALGFLGSIFEGDSELRIERRREGLAVVDPDGRLTDLRFPEGGSTAKHAALLLAEQLTARARAEAAPVVVAWAEVHDVVGHLVTDYGKRCNWKAAYLEDGGPTRLAEDALDVLEAMSLVRREPEGVRALPAIARFAPAAPGKGGRS